MNITFPSRNVEETQAALHLDAYQGVTKIKPMINIIEYTNQT